MKQPTWARLVSGIFHPLFALTIALFLGITFDTTLNALFNPEMLKVTFIILILGTIAFPLVNIFLLKRYGAVSSYELPHRKERFYPLVTTLIYYVLVYILIQRGRLPEVFYSMCMASIATMALAIALNSFMKVSLHSLASGGVLGIMLGLFHRHDTGNTGLLISLILLLGLVGSARLASQSHSQSEVYIGGILGIVCSYFIVFNGWHL